LAGASGLIKWSGIRALRRVCFVGGGGAPTSWDRRRRREQNAGGGGVAAAPFFTCVQFFDITAINCLNVLTLDFL